MKHKILIVIAFSLLHFVPDVSAQLSYGVMAKAGISGFESINLAPYNQTVGMDYNTAICYGVGGFFKYRPFDLPFSIEQALSINKLGTILKIHYLDDHPSTNIDFPYCAMSLPLSLHYHYLEWLSVSGGIAYTYNFKNKKLHDYQYNTFYTHNIDYTLGVDVAIRQRMIVGAYYQRSFNRFMDTNLQFGYTPYHYGIKIGYSIEY